MKYKKLTGIILKKQNYGEADQIISLWTREAGKIRVLAKSLRKNTSKLNFACQDLSLVEISIVGGSLPTLIGVKPLRQFQTFSEDLKKAASAFYAAELMLKITADEHPNEMAFELLADFLICLDSLDYSIRTYPILESFSVKLLSNLGFKVPVETDAGLNLLHDLSFGEFSKLQMESDQISKLHSIINKFIEYIIERNIKSEPFLISI